MLQIDYTCIPSEVESMRPKEFCQFDTQGKIDNVIIGILILLWDYYIYAGYSHKLWDEKKLKFRKKI